MTEIWPMEAGHQCVYSEDPAVCQKLARSKSATWFGTYTKGAAWVAEQYRFPSGVRHEIDQILGSVTSK